MTFLTVFMLSVVIGDAPESDPLTFDEVLEHVHQTERPSTSPVRAQLDALRRSRLPSVRAEVTTNISRTLDLFAEGPYEVRYGTSVLAFDYPLWEGGATSLRIAAVEERLRRAEANDAISDAQFAELLDAFGDLYLAQRETEMIEPVAKEFSAEAARNEELLATGEISNLSAAERDDIALALDSQLLEAQARRIDAATRLRLLTTLDHEPLVALDESAVPAAGDAVRDDRLEAATIAVAESHARLRELHATGGFRALLSGFVGMGAAESSFRDLTSSGSFGVYGLRVHLSYPLFGSGGGVAVAEAQNSLLRNLAAQDEALVAAKARLAEYQLREQAARARIDLLTRSVDAARQRYAALERLVVAGLRTRADLGAAQADRIRREVVLLSAEVERWKTARLLARMTGS